MGIWLPVSTTGRSMPGSMNVSAEAVYAMVSVPWVITTPSNGARILYMHSAISAHSSG